MGFDNLEAKIFWLIGYDDCLPFNTYENLSRINGFKKNNYYLVELPQDSKKALSCTDSENLKKCLKKESGMTDTVCNNISGLLRFEPYKMVPVATHSSGVERRSIEINEYVKKELSYTNENVSPDDFGDIVYFGGKPHINYMLFNKGFKDLIIKKIFF